MTKSVFDIILFKNVNDAYGCEDKNLSCRDNKFAFESEQLPNTKTASNILPPEKIVSTTRQ